MIKYTAVSSAADVIIDKYISEIDKNDFVSTIEDIVQVQKFFFNTLADIVKNSDRSSLKMVLKGKESGEIYPLGCLINEEEKVTLDMGNDQYFLSKYAISDVPKDYSIIIFEEGNGKPIRGISIPERKASESFYKKLVNSS